MCALCAAKVSERNWGSASAAIWMLRSSAEGCCRVLTPVIRLPEMVTWIWTGPYRVCAAGPLTVIVVDFAGAFFVGWLPGLPVLPAVASDVGAAPGTMPGGAAVRALVAAWVPRVLVR